MDPAPEPHLLSEAQVVDTIADRDRLAFALLLGAGASKSAGVSLAWEMIEEWSRMAYSYAASPKPEFADWCSKQDWFDKEDKYSRLFELVCIDPPSRQRYIEGKIKDAFPGWGYLYLANIIQHGRFNIIFTTNFDDLINDALSVFLGYNPVVCAADSEVANVNITSERAKIIKLHGDYLFQSIKNTAEELRRLEANMERKFKEFANLCGFVVIGYAGRDESIMRVFEERMEDASTFPHGIYWGVRPGEKIASRVRQLALTYPRRFHLFVNRDFDYFMARLHDILGPRVMSKPTPLELPETIVRPYEALRERYRRLVDFAGTQTETDPTIEQHIKLLESELDRPWAKAKADDFDLLEAQMALGRRDYEAALGVIAGFVGKHPESVEGLTTWGNALALRAEETGADLSAEEAVTKWQLAIKLDPRALGARYSLARFYVMKQRSAEGISACEELLKLVPNDSMLRRNLVQLYGNAARYEEAERELQDLLQREPKNAELRFFRGSLLEQRGLVPEAIEEVRAAVSLAPQNAWFRFALATNLAKTNQAEEAIAAYEEAIRLDPRNLNFRIQCATYYFNRQLPQRAFPHLQTAATLEPKSAEARGCLCQVLLALGNAPAALGEGEEAVRLSPRDTRIRFTVAMAYQQAGRPQEAVDHYAAAAQLNPTAPEPHVALARLYFVLHRQADLSATLQRLMQLNPQAVQMLQMEFFQQQRGAAGFAPPPVFAGNAAPAHGHWGPPR